MDSKRLVIEIFHTLSMNKATLLKYSVQLYIALKSENKYIKFIKIVLSKLFMHAN